MHAISPRRAASCARACMQDVDGPFGSAGSFFARAPTLYGSYEANPPFVPAVMDAAAERIEALLAAAEAGNQACCRTRALPCP